MLPEERFIETLVAQLDELERVDAVAYYAEAPIPAGADIGAPRLDATAPWDAYVGFVDRVPTANWTHSCRYLLINVETGEVLSIEAELPPFGPGDERRWRVAYKASAVPDSAVVTSG